MRFGSCRDDEIYLKCQRIKFFSLCFFSKNLRTSAKCSRRLIIIHPKSQEIGFITGFRLKIQETCSVLKIFFRFQNFLRCQNNKTNYNLVCETLQFLDIMCGSTTGGLGLLGLYINESNVHLITQTLETLTEYCQGPCQENQVDGDKGMSSP